MRNFPWLRRMSSVLCVPRAVALRGGNAESSKGSTSRFMAASSAARTSSLQGAFARTGRIDFGSVPDPRTAILVRSSTRDQHFSFDFVAFARDISFSKFFTCATFADPFRGRMAGKTRAAAWIVPRLRSLHVNERVVLLEVPNSENTSSRTLIPSARPLRIGRYFANMTPRHSILVQTKFPR